MSNLKTLRKFKKGQSGNPAGRPPDPPEIKALKKMTKGELELLVHKILNSSPDQLKGYNKTVLELWLASGATKAIQQGDYSRLMVLVERLYGKVKEQVEISHDFSKYTDEELVTECERELLEFKKGTSNG